MSQTAPAARPAAAMPDEAVGVGRRVLETEAAGLTALARSLGPDFAKATETLCAVPGRVVVTGIGKSGHIARKLAATFASTGTPSFFVHAAEASHGDLGMITEQDAVICISNSGNAPELADVVGYTRRFSIPLIAITSKADSNLGKAADIVLLLPPSPEACPMGLAPTTSTTMALALGDALAVAMLEARGFTRDDFKVFHPGGALGKRLMRVSELMHGGEELPLVAAGTNVTDAIPIMTSKTFGCVGVVDTDGRLAGIFTDGDLRRNLDPGLFGKTIDQVMTRNPRTISADALAQEAIARMNERSISSLFILDAGGRPVGIVRILDCLRAGVA